MENILPLIIMIAFVALIIGAVISCGKSTLGKEE